MTSRKTDNDHSTEGLSVIEDQLKSVRSAAPPADLLGKLQTDLGNAIDDQAWDDTDQRVEPAVAPAPSRWWHSPSMRIAAAILAVVGAGWFFSREQMPPILGELRPSVASTRDSDQAAAGPQDLDADREKLDSNLARRQLPDPLGRARSDSEVAEAKSATEIQGMREETSTDLRSVSIDAADKDESAQQVRSNTERMSAVVEQDARSGAKAPPLIMAQATGYIGDEDAKVEGRSKLKKEQVTVTSEAPLLDAMSAGSDREPAPEPGREPAAISDPASLGVPVPATPPASQPQPAPAPPRPTQRASITEQELSRIPTRRDSSAVLNQKPNVVVDRVNVGGPEDGRQTAFRDGASEHEKIFSASTERTTADSSDAEVARRLRVPRRSLLQFDAMYFRDYGISQFVDSHRDAESTFGLETDTGSYSIAREYLNRGALPPAAAVRVEEFLNAFDYGDAAPSTRDFSISVEGGTTPYETQGRRTEPRQNGDRAWLRIGVKAREISAAQRNPTSLTFLVDTSGSMAQENRIEIVRESLRLLVNELEPDDSVAIVTYGSRGHVLLDHTSDRAAILRTIDRLHPNGSTNLQEGMEYAYRIASEELRRKRDGSTGDRRVEDRGDSVSRRAHRPTNHRVLLLSDGVANVGLTDAEALLRNVAHWAARGIELTSVGVGMGNYNDELLERLADRGDGRYAYVDRMEEARRLFVENLTGTLQTVGGDARVQVTFDPKVVRQYRLLGYENRDIPDAAFRNKSTDGGEIGAGHTVTALYELVIDPSARRRSELGTVALVYRPNGKSELTEQTRSIRVDTVTSAVSEASPALRLATLAGRFAELLRVSPYVEGDLRGLFLEAQQLIPEFPGDRRVVELADMIGKARDLMLQRD